MGAETEAVPWEPDAEHEPLLSFGTANTARGIYTVKKVRETEVAWSKFEFVTPPKFKKFANENLKAISSRDRQKRLLNLISQIAQSFSRTDKIAACPVAMSITNLAAG
jgi:hypothetical protein